MYILIVFGVFVLATDFIKGKSFFLDISSHTWYEARDKCKEEGMQLAVLNSESDYQDAVSYIMNDSLNPEGIWIGYKKDITSNTFKWINGKDTVFKNWGLLQPNGNATFEQCVFLLKSLSYQFFDWRCSRRIKAYLCEGIEKTYTSADEIITTKESTIMKEFTRLTQEFDTVTMKLNSETEKEDITREEIYTAPTKVDTTTATTQEIDTLTNGVNTTTKETDITQKEIYTTTKEVDTKTLESETTTNGIETTTDEVDTSMKDFETTKKEVGTKTTEVYTATKRIETTMDDEETTTKRVDIKTTEGDTATESVETTTNNVDNTMDYEDTTTQWVDANKATEDETVTNDIDTNRMDGDTTTKEVDRSSKKVNSKAKETCYCSCNSLGNGLRYDNYTFEELKTILAPITEKIRKELLLDKTTLSSYKNKYVSKNDNRPSAKGLGSIGITIIILVSALIILADLSTWLRKV